MNWVQKQRMNFIRERLNETGQISRLDIVREFEISVCQASLDITAFRALHPEAATYDFSKKIWVKA